jgi:hypothetical protein
MLNFKQKANGPKSKISRRSSLNYYRSAQPPSKSPFQRGAKAKKRRFLSKMIDWLIVFIVLAGVIYSLILRPSPTLTLSSTAYRSAGTYRSAAVSALKSFKNRNKLTFDEKGLSVTLKSQFPEISNVSADLPLFGQVPSIQIEIAKPSLLLQGAEGTVAAAERLVIDSKGTVVGPASNFQSVKNLPLITDESGFEAGIGHSVLSLTDVHFILTVIAQAKQAKVPFSSLTLPKLAQEVDLRTADRNYFVKFYLGGDALTQSGQFLAARRHFDKTDKHPRQYLDVRVSGKIYYK